MTCRELDLGDLVFDWRLSDCDSCELASQRRGSFCPSQRPALPEAFNGLMIVGEGPGYNESRLKVPFIGRSGDLLNVLLRQAGLKREECYVANATSCMPPSQLDDESAKNAKKSLVERFPNAVSSCLSRLETEIAHVRPRVILGLGAAALTALTGTRKAKVRRVPRDCPTCIGKLSLEVWKCPGCKGRLFRELHTVGDYLECACRSIVDPRTTESMARKGRCPTCEGRKTKEEPYTVFISKHKISSVAGGVFHAEDLGLDKWGVKYVVTTYHPSHLLRTGLTKAGKTQGGQFLASAALKHIEKTRRLLDEEARFETKWRSTTDAAELDAFLEQHRGARITGADIETDNKDPFTVTNITCVGLRPETSDETLVCDTDSMGADAPLVKSLARFFGDPARHKVFQNGSYDTQTMWFHWGFETEGWTEDTLFAHNAIAPDEPHNLQHIGLTYTDAAPWKPPKKEGGVEKFKTKEELHLYNARDVNITVASLRAMQHELIAEEAEFVYKLDIAKAHVARGMDRVGLPIIPERWKQLRSEVEQSERTSLAFLHKEVGPDFNPNAAAQVQRALFDPQGICGLVPTAYTPTGQPVTDAPTLAQHRGHPVVDALLDWRKWSKLRGTYFDGMLVDTDWFLRTRWNPIGARTGRWSSSPNLQNWPELLRMMVGTEAMPGWKIVGADLSQAEYRIIAALSGDPVMIQRCKTAREDDKFNPEYDPHSYVAAIAFPSYSKLDKNNPEDKKVLKALRDVTKSVVYGLNYGAGAAKVLEAIYARGYDGPPISIEMVERVIAAYFKAFAKLKPYRDRAIAEAMRTGYVRDSLINRRRIFPLRDVDSTVASNYGIQATVGSTMDLSIVEYAHALPTVSSRAFIFAQVHDAIYTFAHEDDAEAVAKLKEQTMSCELQLVEGAEWMPLPATAKIGDVWGLVS